MNTIPFFRYLAALPTALLLTWTASSGSIANAGEPRRIYDLESQGFIDNPDYHEPAAEVRAARTNPPQRGEPARIYDLEKNQFVANPGYHEPKTPAIQHPANYEPRRMYDAESGQYVLNPDYHQPAPTRFAHPTATNRTPTPAKATHRTRNAIASHPRTAVNSHSPV